jgi:cellulose synthase/poly-beta-1,6-N-acetylglucosamine synthase-like glycosyltransferase
MADYVVCIPSYKRSEVCRDKTLATLKKMNIPASKIHVYVANKEEHEEYERILDKKSYNKLVVGIKGLVPQRKFIMDQWPDGKHIVFFDDDVQSIDLTMSSRFKGKSLDSFFKEAFRATRILSADFISPYKPSKFFFWCISFQPVYFYSNLYYKHK